MSQGILFTSKTKMLVANKIDMPLKDVEAMLDVANAAEKNHGSCYVVFDYPTPEGTTIPWATMHSDYFDKHFEFTSPEYTNKFVQLKTLAPTTH